MKKFNIFGDIVPDGYKLTESDVCLQDFKKFLDTVEDGDEITIDVCSCGGDVFQGIAISNLIKQYQQVHNCKFKAHIISIAASIASVICSACDEIELDSNALFMMHLPYSCNVTGNAIDLEKEIEQLNQCKKALISFYRTKFDLTDEEIEKLLIEETWIDSSNYNDYKLNCKIIENNQPMKIAASIKKSLQKFNNKTIIERFKNMEQEIIEEEIKKEIVEEVVDEVKEETTDETVKAEETTTEEIKEEVVEEVVEEEIKEEVVKPTYEELEKQIEELTAKLSECEKKLAEVTDEDVEKRVSGMQSKMQNKINKLTKEFNDRLENSEKELSDYKNQVSDLQMKLDKSSKEFSEMKSAFEEKQNALHRLNASVLKPNSDTKTDWKSLKGKQFIDWINANQEQIKNKQI